MKVKNLKENKKHLKTILCVSIIAVLFIPMLYSSIYLGSIWNVYGRVDKVPVAFVNLDKTVTKDGKEYAIGKEVKNELKDNKKVAWKFVSHEKAMDGVKGTKYYAVIEIPKDFSEKVANSKDGDIKTPNIIYIGNKGRNFVFSQITSRVAESVKSQVSSSIQKEISETLVDSLYEVKNSINDADNGEKELASGTQKLLDGSNNLSNGLNTAANGSKQLVDGLKTISNGETQIVNGSSALVGGLNSLKTELTKSNDKIPTLINGVASLNSNTSLASQKATELDSSVSTLVNTVKEQNSDLTSELNSINSSNMSQEDKDKIVKAISTINGLCVDTKDSSGKVKDAQLTTLDKSTTDVSNRLIGINARAKGVSDGINLLVSGISDSQKNAATGVDKLIAGANSIQSGSNSILNGLNTAAGKTETLSSGLQQLNNGSNTLKNGLQNANDGVNKLSTGLNDGYDKLNNKLKFSSNNMSKFVSNPVTVKDKSINNVKYYGEGLAPYFISLSLWLGAMFISAILSIAKSVKIFNSKFMKNYVGRFAFGAALVTVQAMILSLALIKGVGVEPQSVIGFYGTNIFISVVFFSIMYGLSNAIGILSTPIMFIILLVQLASSAGTFPIETAPLFYRVVNRIIPMTYSVSTLRMTLSGVNWSVLHHNIMVMLIFVLVFLGGGFLIKSGIHIRRKLKEVKRVSEAA